MDLPVVTPEQRARFEAEYREVVARIEANPRETNCGEVDYTEGENVWCLARAYSEMQIENLLGTPQVTSDYDVCPKCAALTVEPDGEEHTNLHCSKCDWVIPITVTALQLESKGNQI